MGTTASALIAGAAVTLASAASLAAPCTAIDSDGSPYAICFDPGNRLTLVADSSGFGAALDLRRSVATEDSGVHWRIAHAGELNLRPDGQFTGAAYSGRYIRHSRDGHIVLPLGPPRKLFLPFDLGAEAEVGRVSGRVDDTLLDLGIFRGAALFDLARSDGFGRRLAIGFEARWDATGDRASREILEHRVAPFSTGFIDGYLESDSGLTTASARVSGGWVWSNRAHWQRVAAVRGDLERVLIAFNDRPLSVFALGEYDMGNDELTAVAGIRLAIYSRSRMGSSGP